jgi:hypothetical protein
MTQTAHLQNAPVIAATRSRLAWTSGEAKGRKIAMVALTTNHWLTIKANPTAVVAACDWAGEGTYTT